METKLFLLLLGFYFLSDVQCSDKEAVFLPDIETLTFYRGSYTFTRRTRRVPQLQCVGDYNACKKTSIDVVTCENKGWDQEQGIQWRCTASMKLPYQFDELVVSCEGISGPDDPYVQLGSCALVYSLKSGIHAFHAFLCSVSV